MQEAGRHWDRIDAALDELLALPAADREARAAQLAGGDEALHRELLGLLRAEQSLGGFMEPTHPAAAAPALPSLTAGQRIGPYRIENLIGRGGMGEVYLATRADGAFEQRVALKLLATPLAGQAEAFRAERQILAQLEHPGIAHLLDGGLSEDGRPYMVLEYVEGEDLLHHCQQRALDLPQRLALFMRIGEAVAHAHRHLVIHRDLKPGNILVTAEGQPKLLDFGIAKLLDPGRLGGEAGRTRHLTPTHAAPEQLEGGATTTATDVYALGVILYELLTGRLPWQITQMPLAQALSRVLQDEAPLPSAAAGRSKTAPVPARLLQGDLDAITLKALRKLPEARYASAAELLQDLERWQRHEPVSARGYGLGYVLRRFFRRHRLVVSAAAAVLVALTAGLAASLSFYLDARSARDRAEAAAATTQAVNDFLNRDLLGSADIAKEPTRDISLRKLLDLAATQIGKRLATEPEAAARVHESIGDSYFNLTANEAARQQYEQALALRSRIEGRNGPGSLAVMAKLANVSAHLSRLPEARALFDEAIAAYAAQGAAGATMLAQLRMEKAGMLFASGQFVGATEEMRQLLESEARAPVLSAEDRLDLRSRYGSQLSWLGEYAQAEREMRASLAGRRQLLGDKHIATAITHLGLGAVLIEQARLDEAEQEIEPALAKLRSWVGPDDAYLAMGENTLARLRLEQGRAAEAEPLLADTLRIRIKAFGAESSFVAWTQTQHAEALHKLGRTEEALRLIEQSVAVSDRTDGLNSPWNLKQRLVQASFLREAGETARAATVLAAIPAEAFSGLPPRHPLLGQLRLEQGLLARAAGDEARARAALEEALGIFEQRHGEEHPRTRAVREQLSP